MSLGIGQIRKHSTVQTRFRAIVDKLARDAALQTQVDTLDFQGWQRLTDDRVKYEDKWLWGKAKSSRTKFFLPREPDLQTLVLWLKNDHVGRFVEDASGFGNDAVVHGYPKLREGIDTGFGSSIYIRFNGTTDWLDIPQTSLLQSRSARGGFTFTCRIYPEDISDPGSNAFRTIASSRDDGSYKWAAACTELGRLRFTVIDNGTSYTCETTTGVIVANPTTPTAYDLCFRWRRPTPLLNSKLTYPNGNVVAIGNDGNLPANVNDTDYNTRWAYVVAHPAWIRVDLGAVKRVAFVNVQWYRGAPPANRIYAFNLATSNDNVLYTTRHPPAPGAVAFSADDKDTLMETYTFSPNIDCRYVLLTTAANSLGTTATSVRTLEIWGSDTPGAAGSAQNHSIDVKPFGGSNTKYTATTSSHITCPVDPDTDFHIGRNKDTVGDDFKWCGGIQDFRYEKNRVYTDAEWGFLNTNKQTILNIPFGSAVFAGMFALLNEGEDYGLEDDGLDTEGFLAD